MYDVLLISYGANGCLSPPFLLFYLFFPGSDVCERARVYVCARACTSVYVLYMGYHGIHWSCAENAVGVFFVCILC